MSDLHIAIPTCAAKEIAAVRCRHCLQPYRNYTILAAGVQYSPWTKYSFFYRLRCACGKSSESYIPTFSLSPIHWAKQIAEATQTRRGRPMQSEPQPQREEVGRPSEDDPDDPGEERPEFHAASVHILNYTPGNYDHADGEPASILTIARRNMTIEPLVFSTADTKKLITKALVTLATYDDPLAQKVLDKYFDADDEGDFHWPDKPPPDWA